MGVLSKLPSEAERALIFLTWIGLVFVKQARDAKRIATDATKDDVEETVKVHGASIKFTQTKGGTVGFGLFNSLEFWLPIFIKLFDMRAFSQEGIEMYKRFPAYSQLSQIFFGIFCLTPLAEMAMPEDWSNPTKDQQRTEKKDNPVYKAPLFLWTIIELAATYQTMQLVTGKHSGKLSLMNKVFLVAYMGFFNGAIGITASHELIHKQKLLDKVAGYMLLCNVNYMHWGEEHLSGHHEKVATPEDPATARMNESFYHFFPRTLIGSFKSSWDIEEDRLQRQEERTGIFKWLRPNNRVLWGLILPFAWAKLLAKLVGGGWKTIAVFYAQGFLSASMLEVINYVEHYGLMREKLPNGKYENVDPTHSWNSPHRLSNAVLFKLQRHSDHHTYASRPYQLLRNFKESPQLPTGYPGMYLLAWFPSAFKWVMNPLVEAHAKNKERLMASVTDENADYSFSKSEELVRAEKEARGKLLKFLIGIGVSHIVIARIILQQPSVIF